VVENVVTLEIEESVELTAVVMLKVELPGLDAVDMGVLLVGTDVVVDVTVEPTKVGVVDKAVVAATVHTAEAGTFGQLQVLEVL